MHHPPRLRAKRPRSNDLPLRSDGPSLAEARTRDAGVLSPHPALCPRRAESTGHLPAVNVSGPFGRAGPSRACPRPAVRRRACVAGGPAEADPSTAAHCPVCGMASCGALPPARLWQRRPRAAPGAPAARCGCDAGATRARALRRSQQGPRNSSWQPLAGQAGVDALAPPPGPRRRIRRRDPFDAATAVHRPPAAGAAARFAGAEHPGATRRRATQKYAQSHPKICAEPPRWVAGTGRSEGERWKHGASAAPKQSNNSLRNTGTGSRYPQALLSREGRRCGTLATRPAQTASILELHRVVVHRGHVGQEHVSVWRPRLLRLVQDIEVVPFRSDQVHNDAVRVAHSPQCELVPPLARVPHAP